MPQFVNAKLVQYAVGKLLVAPFIAPHLKGKMNAHSSGSLPPNRWIVVSITSITMVD